MRFFRTRGLALAFVAFAAFSLAPQAVSLEREVAPSVSPFDLVYDLIAQTLEDAFSDLQHFVLADGAGGEEPECVDGLTPEGEPCNEAGPVADPNG